MLNNQRDSREITCHRHPIALMCLNRDGKYLATASTEGTRIKVFNTYTMQELRVFRFAIKKTEITQL